MEKQTQAKIIEKIQKLLAKAEDTGVSQEEAAAFAAGAQALMQKYAVQHEQLSASTGVRTCVSLRTVKLPSKRNWVTRLYSIVAEASFCVVVFQRKEALVHIFGQEQHIEMMLVLIEGLRNALHIMASRDYLLYKQHERAWCNTQTQGPQSYRNDYYHAAITAIEQRIKEQQTMFQEENQTNRAIVLHSRREAEAELRRRFPRTTTRIIRNTLATPGAQDGYQAGTHVALRPELGA